MSTSPAISASPRLSSLTSLGGFVLPLVLARQIRFPAVLLLPARLVVASLRVLPGAILGHGGDPILYNWVVITYLDRFLAKVNITDGECWEWTAQRNEAGYGRFWTGKVKSYAHIVSYDLFVAPVGSLIVMHRCDNPPCVRPSHLRAGTQKQNMQDMITKGRHSKNWILPFGSLTV